MTPTQSLEHHLGEIENIVWRLENANRDLLWAVRLVAESDLITLPEARKTCQEALKNIERASK